MFAGLKEHSRPLGRWSVSTQALLTHLQMQCIWYSLILLAFNGSTRHVEHSQAIRTSPDVPFQLQQHGKLHKMQNTAKHHQWHLVTDNPLHISLTFSPHFSKHSLPSTRDIVMFWQDYFVECYSKQQIKSFTFVHRNERMTSRTHAWITKWRHKATLCARAILPQQIP